MKWEFLRADEMPAAIEKSGGLCVLPLGCMEKHGPHLPLGTDSLQAIRCVEDAAQMENVMIFPTGMWLGDMLGAGYYGFPIERNHGAIILSPNTLLTVLEELCSEIARNGFRKILIANFHGGNVPLLEFLMQYFAYKKTDYAVMWTWALDERMLEAETIYPYFLEHRAEYPMLTDADMETLKEYAENGGFGGGHANFFETANLMGHYPQLIAKERMDAESGASTHRTDYLGKMGVHCVRAWCADRPNAYSGKPAVGSTETIGQAMNLANARHLAEIFRVLKNDEECIRIATGQ